MFIPMSTDRTPGLPTEVPVPEWPERMANVTMEVTGKVTGTLTVSAMDTDDVFVEGALVYRGHGYPIKYIHTNDQGQPKGYWYARNEAERAKASSGQVYGVIPQDGTTDWALAQVVGDAPKTYRRPLLDALAETVKRYLVEHAEHASQARHATLIQNVNRKADSYNRRAEELAKALAEYEAAQAALSAFEDAS